MASKRFLFSISEEVILNTDEIWPDGDAPENPTEEDVWKKVKRDFPIENLIIQWNLKPELDITEL